jgi:hypothetical protein
MGLGDVIPAVGEGRRGFAHVFFGHVIVGFYEEVRAAVSCIIESIE